MTVENVKQNPLLLAQFENMFIQAIKSHVVVEEKSNVSGAGAVKFVKKANLDNQTLVNDLANIAVPINRNLPISYGSGKNKFTDKVFGKRESYIIECTDFGTYGRGTEGVIAEFLQDHEKINTSHSTKYEKPTHLPYNLNVAKHDGTDYSLSHINANEGLVYRAKNLAFDKQKDLASMIRGARMNDKKAEINEPEWTQQPITELRAGTDIFSLKGSPHETFYPSMGDQAKFYSYKNVEKNTKSVAVSDKLVKINLLNSKISDKIKGFGAGVSGTSMTLYIHALDYMRRNEIQDDNNEIKCRIIKSIVQHVCGINIDDSFDLDNAISFNQNKDIEWKISENIKKDSSGKLKKHIEDLHHSLPEVMMGIEIGKMFVDNGLDFRDNKCNIEFSKLEDIAIKCWHSIDKKNKLAQELKTKTLYDVVQDVYRKIDDTKLFELKKDDSKIALKKQKVSCATKLPARLSSGNVKTLKNDQHMTANIYSKIVDDCLKIVRAQRSNGDDIAILRAAKVNFSENDAHTTKLSHMQGAIEEHFDQRIKEETWKAKKNLATKLDFKNVLERCCGG